MLNAQQPQWCGSGLEKNLLALVLYHVAGCRRAIVLVARPLQSLQCIPNIELLNTDLQQK